MNPITELYRLLFGRSKMADGTVIDMAEHGRVGGVSTGQGFKFSQVPNYNQKVTTSGSVTYAAIAAPGTAQSTALWQVKKVDQTDPNNILTTWADSGNFSQVATDLTILSYS